MQQSKSITPAPIFNHRKRPRQAVIADPASGASYDNNQQGSGFCSNQAGTGFVDNQQGTSFDNNQPGTVFGGNYQGNRLQNNQQSTNYSSNQQGTSYGNLQPRSNYGDGQGSGARNQPTGYRFSRPSSGQQPGPAGAAQYTDLMPVGGFNNGRREAQHGNNPTNQGAAAGSFPGQRNTGSYNTSHGPGRIGGFQRNQSQLPYNNNDNRSNSMTNNNSKNNNYNVTNNNSSNSNNMNNNRMFSNQQHGYTQNFNNKQTFSSGTSGQNKVKGGNCTVQPSSFRSQNSGSTPCKPTNNMNVPNKQGSQFPGRNITESFRGQGQCQHPSNRTSNTQVTQRSTYQPTVNMASQMAGTQRGYNKQISSAPMSSGRGQNTVVMDTVQQQWGESQTQQATSNIKPPGIKKVVDQKPASTSQLDRGLIILTVDVAGVQQWSKFKDTVHIMFELYGYIDSALARSGADSKEFVLRDGQRNPINCIFYEIDRPLPTMVRGQWQRVMGTYNPRSQKLRCLSVRPVGEQEKCLVPGLMARSEWGISRITATNRES